MTKTVKLLGLSLLFMLATGSLSYGQKCKYEYEKTDELTGKTSKTIEHDLKDIGFIFINDWGTYSISLKITIGISDIIDMMKMRIQSGDSIVFKLSTGDLLVYMLQMKLFHHQE